MIELNGVYGYLIPEDITFLLKVAAEMPVGGCYLEVGSWMGLSAITVAHGLLASLNVTARVFCVDTWEGSVEHAELPIVRSGQLFDLFMKNIKESQMDAFISPIRATSALAAAMWSGPKIDVAFY